jgi:predicted aldo/keto reductase-like oxidoreductase
METRPLGSTGLEAGVIGLGTEHLDTDARSIAKAFDLALSAGANYVDLVYNDPCDTHTEYWEAIGPAIRRHRESLLLAVHWGFVYHESIEHCQECFDEALGRLGNGYADVAMLTMVDSQSLWSGWAQEAIDQLRGYQRDGRVGFLGISSHEPEVASTAAASGLIEVLMFPVNLYDHHGHTERETLLQTCVQHQVGVVAMKPYRGGRLLTTEGRPTGITPTQCLHYVLSQPVATTVPGVRNVEEMRQALRYLEASSEERHVSPDRDRLASHLHGQCVLCKHCLPCPQDIVIPDVIDCLDYVEYYGHGPYHEQSSREWYASLPAKGSDCTECGVCLERCPFGVDIVGKMRRAAEVFETVA